MNINEIARLAGVSQATVSRYLNKGYVSEEKNFILFLLIFIIEISLFYDKMFLSGRRDFFLSVQNQNIIKAQGG